MSTLEYLNNTQKLQRREHFRHLVQIAMADGNISDTESTLLRRIGVNLGFSVPETEELIDSTSGTIYNPPSDLAIQFAQVYQMVRLILVDNIVELGEMRLAYNFAAAAGVEPADIDRLLSFLVEGVKAGIKEENLLEDYKKSCN